MRIANMAETVIRTSLRTPNISQLSPTPSLSVSNTSISTHISNPSYQSVQHQPDSPAISTFSPSGSTQATTAQRLQYLKDRRSELEKMLLEKNNLLQQLCRQEAQIIGCYDFDQSIDGKPSTLRRKVNTAFKLPENLLNGSSDKEDEINKLLLGKQIQQQISEASLKLANDLCQTKSIRRTHKNNYDAAQKKLNVINQSLSALKKRQNCDVAVSTSMVYSSQLKQPSPTIKNISETKYATNNNNFLHPTSQLSPSQFNNNNFIGSATNTHQLLMKAYSTHGNISPNINNNHNSVMQRRNSLISATSSTNLDIVPTPTTPNSSRHRQESMPTPLDFTGYNHNHYNPNSSNNNFSVQENSISQKHKLKKSALLDNDYTLQRYSPITCETDTFSYHNHFNQYSPGDIITTTPSDFQSSPQMNRLMISNQPRQYPINYRQENISYLQPSPIQCERKFADGNAYNQRLNVVVDDSVMNEPLNGRITSPPITTKGTLMVHQGLGGYWMTLDNNERVWCSVDRFSSLDRKGQSLKLRKQVPISLQKQPTISTSLGNIEHISKQNIDEAADNLSISSMSSDQKKFKERQWIETSLDCPISKVNEQTHRKLTTPSPPPPTLHQREKKKLSSHSMHSPGRNNCLYVNSSNSIQQDKQMQMQQPCQWVLDKNFSLSALALAPVPKLLSHKSPDIFNRQSKPHPIPLKQPYPLPSPTLNVTTSQLSQHRLPQQQQQQQQQQQTSPSRSQQQMQLRRTASSASSTSNNTLNNPTNIRIESPKNITVVSAAKFQPYKEESKPFEMSDFYKYSTKFRQKNNNNDAVADA